MKPLIILIIALLLAGCDEREPSQLDKEAHKDIDAFFKETLIKSPKTAVIDLFLQNSNIDMHDSSTINVETTADYIWETSGTFVDYKFINSKNINNYVGVYYYIVRFKQKFFRFTFTFYNNGKEIKLYAFSINSGMGD